MACRSENELAQQSHCWHPAIPWSHVSNIIPAQSSKASRDARSSQNSRVSIISFTRIFFVLNVDPHNITASVVRPDIFSCIELTMAIVFASAAGIAGREAISNFVDRFMVSRTVKHDGRRRSSSARYSRASLHEFRMVDAQAWQKSCASIEEPLVVNVAEIHEV